MDLLHSTPKEDSDRLEKLDQHGTLRDLINQFGGRSPGSTRRKIADDFRTLIDEDIFDEDTEVWYTVRRDGQDTHFYAELITADASGFLNMRDINRHTEKIFRPWHDGIRVSSVW